MPRNEDSFFGSLCTSACFVSLCPVTPDGDIGQVLVTTVGHAQHQDREVGQHPADCEAARGRRSNGEQRGASHPVTYRRTAFFITWGYIASKGE